MDAIAHLNKDKKLRKIIATQSSVVISKQKNIYLVLCFSIISQQLSTKVAKVIQERFLNLFDSKTPSLTDIISTPFDTLKSVGLSHAKTNYLLNVCQYFIDNKLTDAKLHKMNDEELLHCLTQIKGVGQWTVEMIMMFAMQREDVFAADDLGIQQAMIKLYELDATNKKALKQTMHSIASPWSPYRTYACRYLWNWKDTTVQSK
jgi:DNA-3-methyladenine glycosylase II